jgi:hypothetical protein
MTTPSFWPPKIPTYQPGDVVRLQNGRKTVIKGVSINFDVRRGGWDTPQYWHESDGDCATNEEEIQSLLKRDGKLIPHKGT